MVKHRNIKILLSCTAITIIVLSTLFLSGIFFGNNDSKLRVVRSSKTLLEVMALVQKNWLQPDLDYYKSNVDFQCPSIQVGEWKKLHQSYFQCRPDFLACALKYEFETRVDLKSLDFTPVFPLRYSQLKNKTASVVLNILNKKDKSNYAIELIDNCDLAELKKGKYKSGAKKSETSQGELFEVLNVTKVDRHLFNFGDLRNLKKSFPIKLGAIDGRSGRLWYEPIDNLNAKQMQLMCKLQGKEILTSEILDAASFLPKQLAGEHQNEFKAPFIYSHLSNIEKVLGNEGCSKIVSKECKRENLYFKEQYSWTGLSQLHGGLLEFVPPVFKAIGNVGNVWTSSWFFKNDSSFQHIGRRVLWEGDIFLKSTFSFEETDGQGVEALPEKLAIGFRCQKKSY